MPLVIFHFKMYESLVLMPVGAVPIPKINFQVQLDLQRAWSRSFFLCCGRASCPSLPQQMNALMRLKVLVFSTQEFLSQLNAQLKGNVLTKVQCARGIRVCV